MIIYGIRNCNTVRKALEWLNDQHIVYEFHDFKTKGIPESRLRVWSGQVGWHDLINRKGTTWRQLDEKVKAGITSRDAAIGLMAEKPTVIRRPLIEENGKVIALGFDTSEYEVKFGR